MHMRSVATLSRPEHEALLVAGADVDTVAQNEGTGGRRSPKRRLAALESARNKDAVRSEIRASWSQTAAARVLCRDVAQSQLHRDGRSAARRITNAHGKDRVVDDVVHWNLPVSDSARVADLGAELRSGANSIAPRSAGDANEQDVKQRHAWIHTRRAQSDMQTHW